MLGGDSRERDETQGHGVEGAGEPRGKDPGARSEKGARESRQEKCAKWEERKAIRLFVCCSKIQNRILVKRKSG